MGIIESNSQTTTTALRSSLCGDEDNTIPSSVCATNTPNGLKKHITPTLIRSRTGGAGKDDEKVVVTFNGLAVLFYDSSNPDLK